MADAVELSPAVRAGMVCARLLADPRSWINRRVETIEMLSHEETRRRVSIDFTLSREDQEALCTSDGVVVPISLLTKAPRRNFDLRGESGQAIPVLGREQNQELAQIALLSAAIEAVSWPLTREDVAKLSADLGAVVESDEDDAESALGEFSGRAEGGDQLRAAVLADPTCQLLLDALWPNYVLFAVLAPSGPNRRVLKYSYGDDFDLNPAPASPDPDAASLRDRLVNLIEESSRPDRGRFIIECPSAHLARSFHVEIAIPQELRVDLAFLHDLREDEPVSAPDINVNRVSLYAREPLDAASEVVAYAEITPERSGVTFQGAVSAVVVALLLWLGVGSGLDVENPGAAVSILLAGAALFSGITAGGGEHPLVRWLFLRPRQWIGLVSASALAGSASLALEVPDARPVEIWLVAAVAATLAAVRLVWSARKAPK